MNNWKFGSSWDFQRSIDFKGSGEILFWEEDNDQRLFVDLMKYLKYENNVIEKANKRHYMS
jgi:hypothetical protein